MDKAAWREANWEKIKAQTAAWREANREKVKADDVVWRVANREKLNAQKKAWRVANLEKVNARERELRKENREKISAQRMESHKANPEKRRKYVAASSKKAAANLADSYVKRELRMPSSQCTPELIEMKREQLLMHRALRELNKTLKEKNGN